MITRDARRWFERGRDDFSLTRDLFRSLGRGIAESESVPAFRRANPATDTPEPFRAFRPDSEPVGESAARARCARRTERQRVSRRRLRRTPIIGQAGQPVITPVVQSASFVPVDVLALYRLNSQGSDTQFRFLYRLNGDFYDSQYSNANEITQRFEIGADVDLEGRHERRLRPAVYFGHHDETNFDPDSGIDREIGGEDISDRLSYGSAGLKSSYSHELEYWSFGFNARVERRRYQAVPILASWDHELYDVRMWTQYQILRDTAVEVGVRSMGRRYDSRLSRDLNGSLLRANDTLRYTYTGADVGLEHRFGSSLSVELNLSRLERQDAFLGYADYSRNAARVTVDYRFNRRVNGSLSAVTRQYDYPFAFAFNQAAGGELELDSTSIEFALDYRITNSLSLWVELEVRDVTSTDQRIAFERTRSMLGIKWRH